MINILAVSDNFGFGAVSKLRTIIKKLQDRKYNVSITFIGNGRAKDYLLKSFGNSISYIEKNTEIISGEKLSEIVDNYDIVLNVMGFHVLEISSNKIRSKEVFVDSLSWMWPAQIENVENCLVYFVQKAFPDFTNHLEAENTIEVSPIIDIKKIKELEVTRKKEILIDVAGIFIPYETDVFGMNYLNTYLDIFLKLKLLQKYSIVVACNKEQKKAYESSSYSEYVDFKVLNHDEFLMEAKSAYKVFCTPGLTFYFESRKLGIKVHYLLPSNYSQALLLEQYKKYDPSVPTLSAFGDEYTVPEKLEESRGVKVTREKVNLLFDKQYDQIVDNIDRITKTCSPDDRTNGTSKIIANGANEIANILEDRIPGLEKRV